MSRQYTLEMVPVEDIPSAPSRSFRLYLLSDRAVNLVDQIHMVSDVGKSDTVDDAIVVLATLIKCGNLQGFRIEDAEQISEILEKYTRNTQDRL